MPLVVSVINCLLLSNVPDISPLTVSSTIFFASHLFKSISPLVLFALSFWLATVSVSITPPLIVFAKISLPFTFDKSISPLTELALMHSVAEILFIITSPLVDSALNFSRFKFSA